MQTGELGQETKFGWNRINQLVVRELQKGELGQESKFGWNGTKQLVGAEIQPHKVSKETELDRDQTGKTVPTKREASYHGFFRTSQAPQTFIDVGIQPSIVTPIGTISAVIKGCKSKSLHQTIVRKSARRIRIRQDPIQSLVLRRNSIGKGCRGTARLYECN